MLSVTTPLQIRNSPLNDSTGKYQWSFGKAPRFKNPNPNNHLIGFEGLSTVSPRKASFGFGTRNKFFDGTKGTISPDTYELPSQFGGKNNKNNRGFSFGHNRNELSFSNYLKVSQQTPAPADYQTLSSEKRGRCYSLRPKTAYPKNYFLLNQSQVVNNAETPGPGKYNAVDQIGKIYMSTKNKNKGSYSFRGKNLLPKQKTTPGPADFMNKTIEPDGAYVLSTMKSSGKRHFLQQKRQLRLNINRQTPGPGSYRKPSDFGHYEGRNTRPSTARN